MVWIGEKSSRSCNCAIQNPARKAPKALRLAEFLLSNTPRADQISEQFHIKIEIVAWLNVDIYTLQKKQLLF